MSQASLHADDFPAFFRELWKGHEPFPWQNEFARRICAGEWPKYVTAPTGSGKTACLDAAVFALAVQAALPMDQRTAGRRIFFVVNRRVIVDEAYERAGQLCQALVSASAESIAGRVAAALRSLNSDEGRPLIRAQLRGGIYRDRSWAGSLLQPMIVCSTVDQAGSRLLFRGYGVSEQARPIHAALVAQDSVLIVDEAHISRPFTQTLKWASLYRLHEPAGCHTVRLPFQFVQMTATPPANADEAEQIALTDADRLNPVLKPRLCGAKAARLVIEDKAKGKARDGQMATRLVEEAKQILAEHAPRSLAIMVNRVATARAVAEELRKKCAGQVTLLIGRLRPLDREALTQKIQKRLKTGACPDVIESTPEIVVSTQCLEVGADLDFDSLVTEAASLDALRQRFGRLNRGGRDITPRAVIVLPADQNIGEDKIANDASSDPIYGNAIPRTWSWLQSVAQDGIVDFGVNSMTTLVRSFQKNSGDDSLSRMLSPSGDAPVLLPAYLDCWVQTNPAPAVDPDVALFLHGPQRDIAEVQICWRADLPRVFDADSWVDILSLCPPTATECLPVPLHVFRNWLMSQSKFEDLSGDVEENVERVERKDLEKIAQRTALIWRGPEKSLRAERIRDISPGDTIVLRVQDGGWQALGIIPGAPDDPATTSSENSDHMELRRVDIAERASAESRRQAVLRIHGDLWPAAPAGTAAAELMALAINPQQDWSLGDIKELLSRLLTDAVPGWPLDETQLRIVKYLADRDRKLSELDVDLYPANAGLVIRSRELLPTFDLQEFESADADALLEARESEELEKHTQNVRRHVESVLSRLPLAPWKDALIQAATLHDWGKADWRFQAMLRFSSVSAAMASGVFLAKSGVITSSAAIRREKRLRAGLPEGFRHELLSLLMAESAEGKAELPTDGKLRALTLHLIATHHGYARPFAPIIQDDSTPDVALSIPGKIIAVTNEERSARPAHAIHSGIIERFWQLTRFHGWWGLALLETVLRLADQRASANPLKGRHS